MKQIATVREVLRGTLDSQQVHVRGWLQNKRTGGGIIFLLLRDGSGVVQCTLRKGKVDEKIFEEFQSARIESSVELKGEVRPDPRAPSGREIQVVDGLVVHPALEEFPIAKQFHGPEFLLGKVLEPMQKKDEEAVRKGGLPPDRVLSFDLDQQGNLLKQLRVKNYGDETRLSEIKNAVRWTFRKMYEKTVGT